MYMMSLVNVVKRYPSQRAGNEALRGVTLRIDQGERVALLGPNGAGKSTLINIITSLLAPTSGTVSMRAERLGFASTGFGLNDAMNVGDFLDFYGAIQGMNRRSIRRAKRRLARAFGFERYMTSRIGALSTGNRQKVALARAMMHAPDLLILDEPMNGLDLLVSQEVRAAVALEQQRGCTTLICSHLVEDLRLCDRVIVVNGGRIVGDEPVGTAFDGTSDPYAYFRNVMRRQADHHA